MRKPLVISLIFLVFFMLPAGLSFGSNAQVSQLPGNLDRSQGQVPSSQNAISESYTTLTNSVPPVPKWFQTEVSRRRAGAGEKTTPEFTAELWNIVWEVSTQYEIDPFFISAVIAVESNFRNVKGPGGVLGMMQILPSTARTIAQLLKLEQPKDWNELLTNHKLNITYGTAYLSYLFKQTGSLSKALERYNNGPKKETFAQTVMGVYERYKSLHLQETGQK
ncbi:transglycosylase SLT domain-containing protein [Fervidobacterium thailandense]|uniref:Transglycosylase SLT domain-containing protein n=1 Tax=Fervidobacterium thailandense TaxID=1008305 RepID=A0A1E3G3I3_9BACT|nr:transglycosylase SLT domain-containing protein [Fervidobacterium thailandense]ODN30821.1 hypothetical protein A4H02_02820 [Fervidobacterium thailandense]